MKPKTEIYCVTFPWDRNGSVQILFYCLGQKLQSDIDMSPIEVVEIKLAFGVLTISFTDGTSHSFGYEPKTMEIFRRTIKPKEDDKGNN